MQALQWWGGRGCACFHRSPLPALIYASRIRLTCLLAVEQNELSAGPSRSGLSVCTLVRTWRFHCGCCRSRGGLLPHWHSVAGSCLASPRMLRSTLWAIVCSHDHRHRSGGIVLLPIWFTRFYWSQNLLGGS